MSYFIELTRPSGEGVTINTDHIATFRTGISAAGAVVTEIMLGGGVLPAFAHIAVAESYEEVARLLPANQVSWEVAT